MPKSKAPIVQESTLKLHFSSILLRLTVKLSPGKLPPTNSLWVKVGGNLPGGNFLSTIFKYENNNKK